MTGHLGILNVGAGDTKLTFDKNNPAERIRSARIVTDMLRRGYALLVEVDDGKGGREYQRVQSFREDACEYIIADFDPITPAAEDAKTDERNDRKTDIEPPATPRDGAADGEARLPTPAIVGGRPRGGPRTRAIDAGSTTGIAVSRSAGG